MIDFEDIIHNSETTQEQYDSRIRSFFLCIVVYVIAAGGAVGAGIIIDDYHPIITMAVADLTATIIVFAFSVLVNNSSIYDPYWSVAPPCIALFWFLVFFPHAQQVMIPGAAVRMLLAAFVVLVWAVRLTYNWAHQWKGLRDEDWRYDNFRKTSGQAYWVVSFFGIHLLPTVFVFLGCLPLFPVFTTYTTSFTSVDFLACIVAGGAVIIEAFADKQLYTFKRTETRTTQVCNSGLWKVSRHPNYFGEVSFWWGLYLFGVAADPSFWWTIIGPCSITLLFFFISIPMMERRELQKKEEYEKYRERTSAFIPWFPK